MPKTKPLCYSSSRHGAFFALPRLLPFYIIAAVFSLLSFTAMAQEETQRRGSRIIDDTTKQIYGPRTSRYFFEQEVFYNREMLHPIDTLIHNFHRWNYVQRFGNLYQDLGNIGSAIQPIYYKTPEWIGVRAGASVYDMYWDTESIRYYDTRSPYSNMRVIIGGKGRAATRATFSRNIRPNWNFGFTYRGLLVDKQVERTGKGDRMTRSNYYDFYTTFHSKDSSYRVFFNFRRQFHRVEEYGGILLDDQENLVMSEFFEVNARAQIKTIETNDLRKNTHIFQQYRVGKALQVYTMTDWYRQKNKFLDVPNVQSEAFYDITEIETDSANDVTFLKTGRHEFGMKGNISKVFYNGYYAIRKFSMRFNNLVPDTTEHITYDSLHFPTTGIENYLGGRISLNLDSIGRVNGWLEVERQGNYRLEGEIRSRWFEARLKQMQYTPAFMEQAYRGTHDVWNNNFTNTQVSQFNGYLHYLSPVLKLSPGVTFTRLHNYIFYKQITEIKTDSTQRVLPVQSSGSQVIASPELRLSITFFRHITLSGQGIYTRLIENADDAIQVPELFINGQLSYDNIFFNGNLDMHAGVDVHWKSDYYAPAYDPAIRQFYVQNSFRNPAFPIVDVFFSAKIKRGRVFFKYNNLVQAFTKEGYLPTPMYPGQANVIDFGFDWSFYD
jgi:hypothetical protein